MDAERQPLLPRASSDLRCRRSRPLTHDEVLTARQEVTWRRARFFLIIMFWSVMAMFISITTYILLSVPKCNDSRLPIVPPVHMTLASLISSGRALQDDNVYTL